MTKLNNEICELNIDELDAVSGGSNFSATVLTNIAANERFNEWQWRDSNSTRQPPANIISSS
jgi:bacteriocin-like protein